MRDTRGTATIGLASIGRTRRGSGLALLTIMAAGLTTASCAAARGPGTDASGSGGAAASVSDVRTPPVPAAPAMLVSCAPGQQVEVRQVARDGVLVPLVTCLDVESAAGAGLPLARRAPVPVEPVGQVASEGDRVVYVPRDVPGPRVRTQPAVYRGVEDTPVVRRVPARRPGRAWQKSAVIIGSAAGIGAGIGGAIGGGKGALIGAAIGGGGATIWDQATRR